MGLLLWDMTHEEIDLLSNSMTRVQHLNECLKQDQVPTNILLLFRVNAEKRLRRISTKRRLYRDENPQSMDQTSTRPKKIPVGKLMNQKEGPKLQNQQCEGMREDLVRWNYGKL